MTTKRPIKADHVISKVHALYGNAWFLPEIGTRETMHSLWVRGEIDRRVCPIDRRYFEYRIRPVTEETQQEDNDVQELDS